MNSLVGEVERLHLNHVTLVHHSINAQHTLYNATMQILSVSPIF